MSTCETTDTVDEHGSSNCRAERGCHGRTVGGKGALPGDLLTVVPGHARLSMEMGKRFYRYRSNGSADTIGVAATDGRTATITPREVGIG